MTDGDGKEIQASRTGLITDYRENVLHRDESYDIEENGKLLGRIIFLNDDALARKRLLLFSLIFISSFALIDFAMLLFVYRNALIPAKRISDFAGQISRENLDIPVSRVESGGFGLFSESFEIMRDELLFAKKREREADKNRREVIVSISHDIKNPVASIQAIAELQSLMTNSEELKREFQTIIEKTTQINGLINNLHTSMLNDLERLTVHPETTESPAVQQALRKADFKKRLGDFAIPQCLLVLDRIRFAQIVDNIISNSYKYADTEMEVRSYFEDDFLCVCIKDYGVGVTKEEEVFLTQKYFRGQNAKDKEGSGMGLYLCDYFMKGMGERLECRSQENGWFEVRLWLALEL